MHDNFKGGALTETSFLILLSLYEPMHGYKIMQFIQVKTNDRVNLGFGTLYGCLKSLEQKKWIKKLDNQIDNSKKKIQYIITELGKEKVELEILRLKELYDISCKIVAKKNI